MTSQESRPTTAPGSAQSSGQIDLSERERLVYTLGVRFAPHLQAAGAAVRDAEHHLADVRAQLDLARAAAASQEYHSDRLVFMRVSVQEEVEGLARKTTPKKVRVAYRYLLDRAVELAEGEVSGYQSDQEVAQRDREHSVAACLEAEHRAVERLEAAQAMQGRVQVAEQAARQGLAVMLQKLAGQPDSDGSD